MTETKDEKMQKLSAELTEQLEKLRDELMEIEKQFNIKKEQFFRAQGALEALQIMTQENS
jgi:SMC interacting uncharacterized protein involved in chromosome segregation